MTNQFVYGVLLGVALMSIFVIVSVLGGSGVPCGS